MAVSTKGPNRTTWLWWFPPARWLTEYSAAWLPADIVAGITLAAYAIPVSLAYATLAGLPPQVGIYGYLLGGLGYALLGSSRQLAIGPTSAISLMIAGTVGAMAEGDAQRYAEIASLTAFTVAALCLFAWLLRLSALVKLISDSILVGFKAGAGLTISMTQLPSLFGVAGGGHNFFDRVWLLVGQLGQMQYLVLAGRDHRNRVDRVGRAAAAGKTGRAGSCCARDHRGLRAGASRIGSADHRKNSGGSAHPGRPGSPGAGCRGNHSIGRRVPAAGLHRRRICRAHLRGEARIRSGSPAGASGHRCCQSRSGDRARLSGRRRTVAVGSERQGRRTHLAGAGLCFHHACAVPALSDRLAGKSSEGGAGGRGVDRSVWLAGFSGANPHVAREPAGFRGGSDRSWGSAASWHPPGHPARRARLSHIAARPACRGRTLPFLAAFPAPTVIRTWSAIPRTSRCPA